MSPEEHSSRAIRKSQPTIHDWHTGQAVSSPQSDRGTCLSSFFAFPQLCPWVRLFVAFVTRLSFQLSPLRSANFPLFAAFSGWTNSVLSGRHPRLMTAEAKSRTIARTQNLKQHPVNWNKPEISKLNHNLNPAKLVAYVKAQALRSGLHLLPPTAIEDLEFAPCAR